MESVHSGAGLEEQVLFVLSLFPFLFFSFCEEILYGLCAGGF